ncbi:putative membrane protein YFL054C [Talaromyces islandicus]|uniref:Putative membrane protein YFL054C n=1 Tax=Talaromyces islandicus TaxID=28573 RepID=A0A0U1M8S1_TALIS|nr:putative membrane protein YFL054C [Talaromyces islandicus]
MTESYLHSFPGVASVAGFFLHASTQEPPVTAYSSFFQIGLAFAMGIMFAIVIAGPTSGGHFNPAVTISLAVWQGFPWKKVPHYILSQTFGSFVAGLLVMGMYRQQILEFEAVARTAGIPLVSGSGPASIFASFPLENQSVGYLFLIEFFVDIFIALVIWSCIDPANPFVSPTTVPIVIGVGYGVMVWGFADITISTNMARDLGCRFVAAIFYGRTAFSYKSYCWISILVNIPATLFATGFYELFLRDSVQLISKGGVAHQEGDEGLRRYLSEVGVLKDGEQMETTTHVSNLTAIGKDIVR